MYKQSVDAIELVIISLDGVIYDLNKYRYNYCKHLCENKNIKYSKFEFYTHLSSMYDMYNDFPLIHKADAGLFNAQVEREMKQYLDYKGIKPKDGFIELIEYLHQKNIQIAIVSTHRTKDAVHYLEVNKLFHKVHYIIGSDAVSHPLPSTQILEMVLNNFHIPAQNTLVLSSFMALNKAANELKMNVIYCEDLVEAGDLEKDSSYKVASSLFDVLNILLFDKYVEADLYSPILGMSSQMNKNELDSMHNKLKETYQDDEDIINLVDQTYAYHLSHLSTEQTPPPQETPEITSKPQSKKRFTFDDDDDEIEEHTIEPEIEKPSDVSMKTLDEKEEYFMLLRQKMAEDGLFSITHFSKEDKSANGLSEDQLRLLLEGMIELDDIHFDTWTDSISKSEHFAYKGLLAMPGGRCNEIKDIYKRVYELILDKKITSVKQIHEYLNGLNVKTQILDSKTIGQGVVGEMQQIEEIDATMSVLQAHQQIIRKQQDGRQYEN